ncbi:unnamed protein product [Trichobilharzia szidati]|nr:unnamed protein product [Trichobilharzia szidati]
MSMFIRKYSKYLSEKIASYRAMAFDFCKVKRGRDDGVLRTMPVDKLLKALPVMQSQILTLLEFDALEKDLNNAIINAAFLLLYKDLIRLFASYNEGMINLIEKYFTLKRRQCRLGLDLYHAFPGLLSKLTEFLTLAESMGIGDKDSLGLQPVPEKVIQAMEQHLQILESKKGSDDEDEGTSETTRSKSNVPKKPTVPVPIPNQKATSNDSSKSVTSSVPQPQPDKTDNSSTRHKTQEVNLIEEAQQASDIDEPTVPHPSVIVNDEDGLPSALQEEIIEAARGHFSETVVKSNEAVKRSSAVNVPVHTQLGRSEHRTVSVPPTRSRSPSPARPLPSPSHTAAVPKRPSVSVSDSEMEEEKSHLNADIDKTKHNLSLLGLDQKAAEQTDASPICGSPFAGDEEPVAPAADTTGWSDKSANAGQSQTSHPSALDDLLGLDLLSSDPLPQSNIEPIPYSAQEVKPADTNDAKSTANTNTTSTIDDLLSLDPLLTKDDTSATPVSSQPQSANPPGSVASGLPAGLKPVPATVPIRPAVVTASQNKNPLDALDSTLSNLASSLGGQPTWGTTNIKKKPLSESGKPT